MIRRPPRSTRSDSLLPCTTRCRSVLIKCLLGLLRPDAGSILVDGEEMVGANERVQERIRAKFGMLFQGGALFDSLPVWRNVTFGLTRGLYQSPARMRAIAEENLERVGLRSEEHTSELQSLMRIS